MDKIVITDVPPLDGEYELDVLEFLLKPLTNEEAHRMKVRTGILEKDLVDAMMAGDGDAQFSVIDIHLARLGKPWAGDLLWKASSGSAVIHLHPSRTEGDAGPPAVTPPQMSPTDELTTSGGESSRTPSVIPENDPSPTGHRRSETLNTGQVSPLVTSVP